MFGSDGLRALDFLRRRLVLILLESIRQEDVVAFSESKHAIFPNRELHDSRCSMESLIESRDSVRAVLLELLKCPSELVSRISIHFLELVQELIGGIPAACPPGKMQFVHLAVSHPQCSLPPRL